MFIPNLSLQGKINKFPKPVLTNSTKRSNKKHKPDKANQKNSQNSKKKLQNPQKA